MWPLVQLLLSVLEVLGLLCAVAARAAAARLHTWAARAGQAAWGVWDAAAEAGWAVRLACARARARGPPCPLTALCSPDPGLHYFFWLMRAQERAPSWAAWRAWAAELGREGVPDFAYWRGGHGDRGRGADLYVYRNIDLAQQTFRFCVYRQMPLETNADCIRDSWGDDDVPPEYVG